MTYAWQVNSKNTQKFGAGQTVVLNEEWSAHDYLKQEFGDMFPRRIESVDGDIVNLKMGKSSIGFASQCLSRG